MNRTMLLKWWDDAWNEGLWAAAWSKSIQDLTPEQAAWKPSSGRNSIWQVVSHMIFWREEHLRLAAGGERSPAEEVQRLNFPEPKELTAAAWKATLEQFEDTQRRIRAALADEKI